MFNKFMEFGDKVAVSVESGLEKVLNKIDGIEDLNQNDKK